MPDMEEIMLGVTFPGIIAHEVGHLLFCKLTGTKIKKYSLLRPFDPLGYVVHVKPKAVIWEFLIVMGPLVFNSMSALVFFMLIPSFRMPLNLIVLWLGFSLAYNSFPSRGDGMALYTDTMQSIRRGRLYNIVYLPFVYLIYHSQSQPFWRNLFYPLILLGLASMPLQ